VVDLMEVLKASLNARGKSSETKERKAPKKAPASGEAASARKSRR
jgi:non-homologous end joining protein Ku